nr:leucine-rich repeat extensin-like protein 3 [Coffea arabica]
MDESFHHSHGPSYRHRGPPPPPPDYYPGPHHESYYRRHHLPSYRHVESPPHYPPLRHDHCPPGYLSYHRHPGSPLHDHMPGNYHALPPPPGQHPYEVFFSDENPNGCIIT